MRDLPESQLPSLLARLLLFPIIFSEAASVEQRRSSVRHCTREGCPSFELEKLGAMRPQSLAPLHHAPCSSLLLLCRGLGGSVTPMQQQPTQGLGCGEERAHEWAIAATAEV